MMSKLKLEIQPTKESEKVASQILSAVWNKTMKRTISSNTLNSTLNEKPSNIIKLASKAKSRKKNAPLGTWPPQYLGFNLC